MVILLECTSDPSPPIISEMTDCTVRIPLSVHLVKLLNMFAM